ncbi:MAG: HAMP domain-containing protein [Bryobacterales bacterium]|nr:HAMP domain-containing protein [Bryobacterales bacterium]MBV9401705.1 HAMP domain-containing protein [Bryobacterales bacterium]
MKKFADWSIRYKLLSLLLLLGITTFLLTGGIAYIKYLGSLKQGVFNQLTGIRRSKAFQIESYYRTIHSHVLTLSEDRMFFDAMREFKKAYASLNAQPVPPEVREAVIHDYRDRFYPQMQQLGIARPRPEDYLVVTPAAFHLQYAYIVKNPYPEGQRRDMADTGDGSEYSRVHAKYHRPFRGIIENFGYYDLDLIDYETGSIVYEVNKDRDFASSLTNGPYRDSNLAKVVKLCLATNNPNDVFFSDFEHDEAAKGEPTQYVASPIFDGNERLGVFALQLSTAAIDDVMTGRRGWERDGLGQTGQSVIVGDDYLLRTNVRGYLEDPEKFLARQKANGISDAILNMIRTYKSTILEFPAMLEGVKAGLEGKEGTMVEGPLITGKRALESFMPLKIEGLHWMLGSRMDLDEAQKPVREVQRLFSWLGAGLLLLTVTAALLMTREILRPVNALVDAAQRVSAGDLNATVKWKRKDELGVLSNTFNAMTKSIREKTAVIEQKNRENEALLLNILPGEIAARLKAGENEIADSFADVTVLFADLVGFTVLSSKAPAAEIVDLLNGLFSLFDQAAEELGIEKIKTIGDCYMAVCGLPRPCPSHAEKMALMALRMTDATRRYGEEKGFNLQLRIGLNSGPVVAGVIGVTKFIYDLWGDTVNLASRMESTGIPGEIQVTRSVYERLKDKFEFESRGRIQVKGKGEIEAWLLRGQLRASGVSG